MSTFAASMALLTNDFSLLTADDIQSYSANEIRSLSADQLQSFSVSQLQAFTTTQVRFLGCPGDFDSLNPTTIAALTDDQLAALRPVQGLEMTAAQAQALSSAQVAVLNVPFLRHLSADALQALTGLTAGQASMLTWTGVSSLSASQFADLVGNNPQLYWACKLRAVNAAQMGALSAAQIDNFSAWQISLVPADAIAGINASVLGSLKGLIVGAFSSADIAALSVQQFDALAADNLANIAVNAVAGISAGDLASLSAQQAASFTASQIGAMSDSQLSSLLNGSGAAAVCEAFTAGNALTYDGALKMLETVTAGGMNSGKLAALDAVDAALHSGALQATGYVTQMFDNVVEGNSANATWSGGSFPVALGDLSSTSTAAQADELIQKWFLGTDYPNPWMPGCPWFDYEPQDDSLYGASGAPQLTDVNQGITGDCYFLAAIGEIALQDPSAIENAIQANGNGTYSVRFYQFGTPVYETVDSQLPMVGPGTKFHGLAFPFDNGNGALWSPLLEKAFAQLNEQNVLNHGSDGLAVNGYYDIAGGAAWPLSYFTNDHVSTYYFSPVMALQDARAELSAMQTAFQNHAAIEMATNTTVPGGQNLVASHMFAVTGFNAAADTVSLYNPWGINSGGMPDQITIGVHTLMQGSVEFFATNPNAAYPVTA